MDAMEVVTFPHSVTSASRRVTSSPERLREMLAPLCTRARPSAAVKMEMEPPPGVGARDAARSRTWAAVNDQMDEGVSPNDRMCRLDMASIMPDWGWDGEF